MSPHSLDGTLAGIGAVVAPPGRGRNETRELTEPRDVVRSEFLR